MNFTVRASFEPPTVFRSQELRSAILKYAAPFMALDPTKNLPTSRQAVEAWTLNALSGTDSRLPEVSTVAAAFPEVQFPRVIYHDESKNVLWISDLGKTQTLSEYLCSDPPPSHEVVARIATQVAGFTAELMRATTISATKAKESLDGGSEGTRFVEEWVANKAGEIMTQFGIPDAEEVKSRMLCYVRGKIEEPCFGMADLWPGNILITTGGESAFVDWELFGVTTAGTQLGGFVAPFHTLLFNDQVSSASKEVIQVFMTHFLPTWKKHYGQQVSSYFKTRFLFAYGGEVVSSVEFSHVKLSDEKKAQLVLAGTQCLRAAGSSSGEVNPSRPGGLDDVWQRLWEDVQDIFQG